MGGKWPVIASDYTTTATNWPFYTLPYHTLPYYTIPTDQLTIRYHTIPCHTIRIPHRCWTIICHAIPHQLTIPSTRNKMTKPLGPPDYAMPASLVTEEGSYLAVLLYHHWHCTTLPTTNTTWLCQLVSWDDQWFHPLLDLLFKQQQDFIFGFCLDKV